MAKGADSYLDILEAESIAIIREVPSQFERPVLLFSVGKDSSVMVHLARKAFAPGPIPFPLMHIDTGFKFSEMYEYRDKVKDIPGVELIVHRNEEAIAGGANPFELGTQRCCALLKTQGLLQGLQKHGFTAALGAARREEEKSRAKERIFSFRDVHGQWDPKCQRPELWGIYNGKVRPGESIRVFPISNWTELDVWRYIERENIPVVPLYFAKKRKAVRRKGMIIVVNNNTRMLPHEEPTDILCRFRTLGCVSCTSAVESSASSIGEIVDELLEATTSERAARAIDHDSDASMETKKREGYF